MEYVKKLNSILGKADEGGKEAVLKALDDMKEELSKGTFMD